MEKKAIRYAVAPQPGTPSARTPGICGEVCGRQEKLLWGGRQLDFLSLRLRVNPRTVQNQRFGVHHLYSSITACEDGGDVGWQSRDRLVVSGPKLLLGGRGFESYTVKNSKMVAFAQMWHLVLWASFYGHYELVGASEGERGVSDTLGPYEGEG